MMSIGCSLLDKMGHNDVRSLLIENCGSTSTRDLIVTHAIADKKPSPHKITPYEDFNALKVKANAKTRQVIAQERIMNRLNVGPFWMTNNISEDDIDLLSFAFYCNPLDPKSWRYTLNQICAKLVRPDDRMTSCARTHKLCHLVRFDGRLKDCMQIYIPMHYDIIGHWYLLVCDIFHKKVEIWNSLPNTRHNKKRENDCQLTYDSNIQWMRLAIELLQKEKNQLHDVISEALKVMENASDFTAKGKKIGNVEVKEKDVVDVTVSKKEGLYLETKKIRSYYTRNTYTYTSA
ncbi:unnamed protein product, partial [Prunus brigantina]